MPRNSATETRKRDDSLLTNKQVISKQRVADHGEVLTGEREVNAMLDLVKQETERIDLRFLEPACGTGKGAAVRDEQVKHLELIQAVVNRLAGNSFAYKGWAITLVAALIALNAKEASVRLVLVALLPAVAFWGLDAYYLRQERLFRKLYDAVRVMDEGKWSDDPFTMNTAPFAPKVQTWLRTSFSRTVAGLYIPLVSVVMVVAAVVYYLHSAAR